MRRGGGHHLCGVDLAPGRHGGAERRRRGGGGAGLLAAVAVREDAGGRGGVIHVVVFGGRAGGRVGRPRVAGLVCRRRRTATTAAAAAAHRPAACPGERGRGGCTETRARWWIQRVVIRLYQTLPLCTRHAGRIGSPWQMKLRAFQPRRPCTAPDRVRRPSRPAAAGHREAELRLGVVVWVRDAESHWPARNAGILGDALRSPHPA